MAQSNGIPSAFVQAKKAALLEMQGEWRTVRDKATGQRTIRMPNVDRTRVYIVEPTGKACSCTCGQNGGLCSHRLAAIEAANQEALTTWVTEMVKPRKSYADLYPQCRTCDDLADGASDGMCGSCASDREYSQRARVSARSVS